MSEEQKRTARGRRSTGLAFGLLCLTACGRVKSGVVGTTSDGPARDAAVKDSSRDAPVEGARPRECAFAGFATPVSYVTTHEALHVVAVDRTKSGHLDLVVGERDALGPTAELLTNAGDGSFVLSSPFASGTVNGTNVVAADFSGDGKIDLASQANGSITILLGSTGGFSGGTLSVPAPQTEGTLATADFDRDGRADLAFAGENYVTRSGGLPVPAAADFALNVFLGAGDGRFTVAAVGLVNPSGFQSLATGDFDGDGNVDIAELTATTEGGFDFFSNAGGASFRDRVKYVASPDWIAYGLAVADLDGDGKDDVATTTILTPNLPSDASVLAVFSGDPSGRLRGPIDYTLARTPTAYRIVTGDFNGDTRPDLAMVIGQTLTGALIDPVPVNVFENRGDGTFGEPVIYTVDGGAQAAATDLAAGDFNGDGVSDLAVTTFDEAEPYSVRVNVLLSRCESFR